MSQKVWTRESLTEQILADTAGLWKDIESHQGWANTRATATS